MAACRQYDRALELFDGGPAHDDIVGAQAVGGGQLAGQVSLLPAAGPTELPRAAGTGPQSNRRPHHRHCCITVDFVT